MKLFGNLFSRSGSAAGPQNTALALPGTSMGDVLQLVTSGMGAISDTGVPVTQDSALRLAAVFACIRVLSSTVAGLPFHVYRATESGSEIAKDHPANKMIGKRPNPMMTSFIWREAMMGQVLTRGNAYAVIARNGRGEALGFYPVDADLVKTERINGKKWHKITTSKGEEVWRDDDVIHIPGFGFDGIVGISPILNYAREVFGLALATQKHESNFFKNGASVGATLQTEQNISSDRQKEILANFKANFTGVENSKKIAMLVDGFKLVPLAMNNEDAQLIEALKLQASDIARVFGVPPHMIGILDKATYSNIEQQSIDFVQYSLLTWVKRIEQEFDAKLFPEDDYFVRFNLEGLLRGDYATRMDGHSKALNAGIFTINEVRALENHNRIEGGDTLRVPLNMAALGKDGFTAIDQKSTSQKPSNPDSGQ